LAPDPGLTAKPEPGIPVFRITDHHGPEPRAPLGKFQGILHGRLSE